MTKQQQQLEAQRAQLIKNLEEAGLSAQDAFDAAHGDQEAMDKYSALSDHAAIAEQQHQPVVVPTDEYIRQAKAQSDTEIFSSMFAAHAAAASAIAERSEKAELAAKEQRGENVVDLPVSVRKAGQQQQQQQQTLITLRPAGQQLG